MNIYDIAKLANVSIATVSRVVNNSPKVSPKTKEKVLTVMKENEYTPNAFARGLGLGSMKTVGIICPNIDDIYMAKAVSYLERNLHAHGYDCILGCSGHTREAKENYVKLLLSKRIDALVMVGSTYGGNGVEEKETAYIKNASKQAPVFLINSWIEGENIYCSNADDFSAAYEVTSALIRRGKKRILFLYDSETFSAKQKMEGYERALSDAGYPVLGDLKFRTKNEIHHARDLMLAYKNLEFDSVFAVEDGLAVAALKYAKVKGISVPEELSVVGYNNSPLSVSCEPELTSVDSRIEQQCYIAVENIVKVLEGNTEVSHRTIVPCEIVKRCTTDF